MQVSLEGETNKNSEQTPGMPYLSVAATADHSIPLGDIHTAGMLDQVIVCSANVGIRVTRY